jgi:hypothetical protein
MPALPPALASIRDELDAATKRLHALADPLDDTAWSRRPAEGRWCVAECVEHLNLTSRAFLPILREAVGEGRARGLTAPAEALGLDFVGRLLLRANEPPVKRHIRIRTTPPFVPPAVDAKATVLREFEELQRSLIALLDIADGLALAKIKVRSPFNAKLGYSVYAALRVIPAHQRRHLWQAERALADIRKGAR